MHQVINIYNNNLFRLFMLLIVNIYAFNNYESLSKFDNIVTLVNETLPISIILLISYFADYIRTGFKNIDLLHKFEIKYHEYENYIYLLSMTLFIYFNKFIFQLMYFWCVNISAIISYSINYIFNLPLIPFAINHIQKNMINDSFKISYYNNLMVTFGIIYLLCLYYMRYTNGKHYELFGLVYLITHYFIAPSIFKLILNKNFDIIIYFNFKIIVTVFINQLINFVINIVYPSWINNNLIPFGGLYLWSLYTFLAYFVLEIYDPKILFGYMIIAFQYQQNPNNSSKQFKSIPNQLICIFIDCVNIFFNEYKNRENQKKINNHTYKLITYTNKKDKYISYYQIKLYDKLLIPQNETVPQDCVAIENVDNRDSLISINTSKIDGEINDKFKKIVNYKKIDKNSDINFLIDTLSKNDAYFIKKGSIVKSNTVIVIINIPNTKNYLPKLNNNKYSYFLKYIEKFFIIHTLSLTAIHASIYLIIYNEITIYTVIHILMSVQMINPMILNTILLFTNNLYKNINLSLNAKFKLISIFNKQFKNINTKLIHFTDKTGTLTKNKLTFFGIGYPQNDIWKFYSLENIKNDNKIIRIIVSCTLNDKINDNIVPEEKAIFNSLDVKWFSSKNLAEYTTKQVEVSNKYFVVNSINLGIDKILRGSYTLLIRKNHETNTTIYNIIIQCSNNLFSKLSKSPIILNTEKTTISKEDLNELDKHTDSNGAPRFWNLLISQDFNDDMFNSQKLSYENIRNISIDSINNNFIINIEKYHHQIINFISDLEFNYIGCLLIKDIYMDNANNLIKFNENHLKCNTCMITGDNYANASIIAEHLDFDTNNNIFYCSVDEFNDYILSNNKKWFINKNIVFYNCEPENKELIIKYFKNHEFDIIYSGDGLNDIYAMRESDFVISFPDSSLCIDNKYQINPYVEIQTDMNINTLDWNTYLDKQLFSDVMDLIRINNNTINTVLVKQTILSGLYGGFIMTVKYNQFSDPFDTFYYQFFMLFSTIISFKHLYLPTQISFRINKQNLFEYIKYYFVGGVIFFIPYYLNININISLLVLLFIQMLYT